MNKKRKMWKMFAMVSLAFIIIVAVVGYTIGNYFYNLAINPVSDKSVVFESSQNVMNNEQNMAEIAALEQWFTNSNYTHEYITANDDLKLHAYQIHNETPTSKWVIICHGYMAQADYMKSSAKHFYDLGYNVLLPNARGHGESEGDYIGMGWHERLDMVDWISQITEQDANAQIVLYGVSMGGATVMMTSGEKLPANVKAIVEDCGYTSVHDIFDYQLQETFGFPSFPIMNFASIVTNFKAGYHLKEASALEQVKKSKTPMLFIHGDEDTFVPYRMVQEVYDAANVEKELYIVSGAGHGGASSVDGENYWLTVENFINKYMQ